MSIFKNGMKLSGSIIIAAVISFFLCISLNVICTALFTEFTGYRGYVYENETSEEVIAEYEYNYSDGTDTKKAEYEAEGYTVTTVKMRSSLTGSGKVVFLVLTQLLSLIMIVAFASTTAYKQGFKDSNLVNIGHIKRDNLKGLKIGLVGNAPFYALFVLIVVMSLGLAPDFLTVWYAFLNSHFYSFIMLVTNGAQTVSQLVAWQYVLLLLLQFIVPAVSTVAYILGVKEINLSEKIVYKKEGK